jgi:hypothetical protein
MLAYMMIVVWMWSRDTRADSLGLGRWLEAARRSSFEELVGGQPARTVAAGPGTERGPGAAGEPAAAEQAAGEPSGAGSSHRAIDDEEHLAAYNAYLAQLNRAAPPGDGALK